MIVGSGRLSLGFSGLLGNLLLHTELPLDVSLILVILLLERISGELLPLSLFDFNLLLKFHLSLEIAVIFQGLEFFFDLSERKSTILDEEVVHDIGVVSLEWHTVWTNADGLDTINLLKLIIFLVITVVVGLFSLFISFLALFSFTTGGSALGFVDHFLFEFAHSELSEDSINIVIELNIHLDSINNIQLTSTLLVVATFVRNRALSGQDLGHVVILDVRERFLVIFVASAHKIMHVIDNVEDLSVHFHEFDQSHVLSFESLEVTVVENLDESNHDNMNLSVIKSIS